MGYSFIVGEKIEDKGDPDCSRVWAENVYLNNAPADGSPTDHTNERWPSYSGWDDLIKDCERHGDSGVLHELIPEHPGYVQLTLEINLRVQALQCSSSYNHTRLEWLKFWSDWAVKNCKDPVFANS